MEWVAIDVSIAGDPAVHRMAEALRIRVPEVVGLLGLTFAGMAQHAEDGQLAGVTDTLLEQWAHWHGKRGVFAKQFRAELCDATGLVKAWEKFNGAHIRRAKAASARTKAWREKQERERAEREQQQASAASPNANGNAHGDATVTHNGTHNGTHNVGATVCGTGQDQTGPDLTTNPLPPQAPQGEEETKLHARAAEAWPVVVRFLAGKDATARAAWIGRFHGAMDRPPHPSGAELRDALEDLMTEPREKWNPALFRRYVERIRRDAERDAERAAAPAASTSAPRASAADAAWDIVLSMLPQWQRREITAETHAALPDGIRRGLSKIGGFRVLAETSDAQRVWLKKDFLAAYRGSPVQETAHV